MINLKYAVENTHADNGQDSDQFIYLPLKIGEFRQTDDQGTLQMSRSYVLQSDFKSGENLNGGDNLSVQLQIGEGVVNMNVDNRRENAEIAKLEKSMSSLVNKLQKRIEDLEKSLSDMKEEQKEGACFEDNAHSIYSSPALKEQASRRSKSEKGSNAIDIAYLYSVPLVMQHNFKMSSMGLPIDHNTEILDIIKGLESTHKMINFKIETATVDALSKL